MANYNGSLQADDCRIHSVRFDRVLESRAGGRLRCLIRSPRGCSDADTTNKCLSRVKDAFVLSRTTIMGHYKQMIVIFTSSDTIWC
eukprot:scaffold17026_cov72-Skeletonema_dohrnii-CCMP3373.AAC.1